MLSMVFTEGREALCAAPGLFATGQGEGRPARRKEPRDGARELARLLRRLIRRSIEPQRGEEKDTAMPRYSLLLSVFAASITLVATAPAGAATLRPMPAVASSDAPQAAVEQARYRHHRNNNGGVYFNFGFGAPLVSPYYGPRVYSYDPYYPRYYEPYYAPRYYAPAPAPAPYYAPAPYSGSDRALPPGAVLSLPDRVRAPLGRARRDCGAGLG